MLFLQGSLAERGTGKKYATRSQNIWVDFTSSILKASEFSSFSLQPENLFPLENKFRKSFLPFMMLCNIKYNNKCGVFFVTLNRYIYPSTVGSHTVYEANSYSMGIMAILEILNVCLLFLPFHQDLISYSSLNSVKGKKNRIPRTVKGTNHGRKHIEILEI